MLSDRRQKVLSALIEEYIAYALPVGSRTLTERYHLGVSPATVRNELSVLEEAGYITQPHTSAGRVPTDVGYRAFVDDLLRSDMITDSMLDSRMVDELRQNANELDTLIDHTSHALTQLTDCLSIVLAPSVLALRLKQISVISLSDYRALIVLVTEDGQVLNRHIDFADEVHASDLASVQNFLNSFFAGKALHEVKEGIDFDAMETLQQPLMRAILEEALLCLKENETSKPHHLGVSSLMRQPEFSHSEALVPLIQALEDDAVLLRVFKQPVMNDDLVVSIGHENPAEELAEVSVVAGKYGRDDAAGVVAVIGPTRMDYSRVIQAVRIAQNALKDI